MKKAYFLLGVIGLILLTALILRLISLGAPTKTEPSVNTVSPNSNSTSTPTLTPNIPVSTNSEPQASFTSEALVLSPKQNELISSPLKVEGEAKGTWFFEASLPVKLFDSENNIIVSSPATAQSDWMTERPVKFISTLIFSTTATSGYLVIAKDNPSGLPENDASITVPVRFK